MNRRTFLKTLVALGASLPLPLDLLAATEPEIDATWERIRDVWGLFEVDDYGTLSYANFEEPRTRREAYDIADAVELDIGDIENIPVLAGAAQEHYAGLLQERFTDSGDELFWEEIESMAADDWPNWARFCSPVERVELDEVLNEVLGAEPDWQSEWEWFYRSGDAQGAAYDYFLQQENDVLEELGVVIVEGDHPGSSYLAAELEIPVEQANAIAAVNGWMIRFVREGAA